jgi:hypothetical protein
MGKKICSFYHKKTLLYSKRKMERQALLGCTAIKRVQTGLDE